MNLLFFKFEAFCQMSRFLKHEINGWQMPLPGGKKKSPEQADF
jgi:hypothetical protein